VNIWLHNVLCNFFIHLPCNTQGRVILGRTVLYCLTFGIKKIKTYGQFILIFWRGPSRWVTEMKVSGGTLTKREYEEIRDSKLLEILKRDRTLDMVQVRIHVKTSPLFSKINHNQNTPIYGTCIYYLIFVIQMFINVFLRFVFVRIFFFFCT
jgi:hypothetical protein